MNDEPESTIDLFLGEGSTQDAIIYHVHGGEMGSIRLPTNSRDPVPYAVAGLEHRLARYVHPEVHIRTPEPPAISFRFEEKDYMLWKADERIEASLEMRLRSRALREPAA